MDSSTPLKERWLILIVLCLVLFIVAIDNTVLNLALPSISEGLSASASQLQWIVDAYPLVFAALLITTGSIGDLYGRKRMLVIGLGLFGVGSLGAALSVSTGMLTGFRLLQGLAGATVMPSTLSILTNVFRNAEERAKAIAIWSGCFSIGAGIGPVLGGFLIEHFHWSSAFYINLPIIAICLIGTFRLVPESVDKTASRPDLLGAALSILGLLALAFSIIRAGEEGWTANVVLISFAVAAIVLTIFIWWENHTTDPMLPLSFFKNMSFTGANVALALSSFGLFASTYLFSQFFQSVQGYRPLIAALMMIPMSVAVLISTMASVRVNRLFGTRVSMCAGLLFIGLGLFLFSRFLAIEAAYWHLLLAILILGTGIGLMMSPATNAVMNSLPPHRAGVGSALNDTTRELGGALGVAVLGSLMNRTYRTEVGQLDGVANISADLLEQIRSSVQNAHLAAARLEGSLSSLVYRTSSQAFVDGMRESMTVACIVMVVAAVVAWFLIPAEDQVYEPGPDELEWEYSQAR